MELRNPSREIYKSGHLLFSDALADSYYGTLAHQMMKDVVRKGGVIGGSSAGASIQARYLARATPIENFKIMAPGYELPRI